VRWKYDICLYICRRASVLPIEFVEIHGVIIVVGIAADRSHRSIAQPLFGVAFELIGLTFELIGLTFELIGLAFELIGLAFELIGVTFELIGLAFELIDITIELIDIAFELIGRASLVSLDQNPARPYTGGIS
jgi:hypothetical protein